MGLRDSRPRFPQPRLNLSLSSRARGQGGLSALCLLMALDTQGPLRMGPKGRPLAPPVHTASFPRGQSCLGCVPQEPADPGSLLNTGPEPSSGDPGDVTGHGPRGRCSGMTGPHSKAGPQDLPGCLSGALGPPPRTVQIPCLPAHSPETEVNMPQKMAGLESGPVLVYPVAGQVVPHLLRLRRWVMPSAAWGCCG